MPDFDKSTGQRMEQKSSDKFDCIDSGLLDLFGFTIFVCKSYLTVFQRYQTMVGDGHPMGVPAQILQYLFRLLNGIFKMNDPVFRVKSILQVLEPFLRLIRCTFAGKTQLSLLKRQGKFILLGNCRFSRIYSEIVKNDSRFSPQHPKCLGYVCFSFYF